MPAATKAIPASCPAQIGSGVEITTARFGFAAHECFGDGGTGDPITEIFGYFHAPADHHVEQPLQTETVEVTADSPMSRLGRLVKAAPHAQAIVASDLRQNILNCPCSTTVRCPAVTDARLLDALRHAAASFTAR
jgi:hypothetical protein